MKVGLLISHDLHSRNFIASGLAAKIADKHELVILRPKELGTVGGPWRRRVREAFVLASMVAREPGSKTYRFKLGQNRPLLGRLQIRAFRHLRDGGMDLEGAFRRWEARQQPLQTAVAATRGLDVLLWPTLLHTWNEEIELVKSARGQKCRIVAAPASWDTLTTKASWLVSPHYLLVWGEASKRHAEAYHRFRPDQVTVTGPPQFDLYYEPLVGLTSEEQKIVLVVGSSVHYWSDELKIIKDLRHHFPGSLIHRPHPRRGGEWSLNAMWELRLQLQETTCVVAAFSTVIIEAALMGKPSLLVGFGQSSHGPAMAGYHMQLEHMAEITTWPGVKLCQTMPELVGWIKATLNGAFDPQADELRRRAQEVALCDGHAQERILAALDAC